MSTVIDQETKAAKAKDFWYYFHSLLTVIIMFGFGYLPTIAPLTDLGMDVLGIFLGLLYGWIFVEMIWPSLLSLLALGMTEYTTILGAFSSGFGHNFTLMIFFILIFATYLDISGLNQTIANWFISRKIVVGRPWVLIFMILLASYVLAATVSQYGTIIILWAIMYKICDVFGYQKESKFAAIVIIGIIIGTSMGCQAFLFKPFSMLVVGIVEKTSGLSMNFLGFATLNFIISMITLVVYLVICKFLIRPDLSELANKGTAYFESLKPTGMPKDQKLATGFLAIFMFMMFAPSVLPKTWALQQLLNSWGVLGSAAACVILICAVQFKGKKIAFFDKLAQQGLMWELLILFAATMPVSAAMESSETGVMDAIVMIFTPILSGLNPVIFIITACVLVAIITQFAHNLVLAVIFTPIFTRMAIEVGADPLIFGMALIFALNCALITPGSSAPSAMIHTNSWVSKKQAYLYTTIAVITTNAIALVICLTIGKLFL